MSKIRITLFFVVVFVVLFLVNFTVFEAWKSAFGAGGILASLFGFFSFGFIAVHLVGTKFYNVFTRVSYLVFSVWMGLFTYLFFASLIYLPIAALRGERLTGLALVLASAALLTTLYGLINARRIRTKYVTVRMPGISDAWKGRKIVWISDLHLGQVYGQAWLARIVQRTREKSPDILFIGGDLFDGMALPGILSAIEPLRNLKAPLGTYFITGNHEEIMDDEPFVAAVRESGIRVMKNEMLVIDDLQIIGADYAETENENELRDMLSLIGLDGEKPSVLLRHEPNFLDVSAKAGITLSISGHTHRAQIWPLEYIARLSYKGYAYGLKKYDDMAVYVSSGAGTWGPPLRVGSQSEIVLFTFTG